MAIKIWKSLRAVLAGAMLTALAACETVPANTSADANPVVTAQNVKTDHIEVNGIRYAFRRLGPANGIPLVLLMHIRGTLDYWDPAVVNGFAKDRPVILFSNAGLGTSTGEVAATVEGMAKHTEAFIDAMGLKQVDLLGFSLGGFVAQQVAIDRPDLVHGLVLAGSAPRGGVQALPPETEKHLVKESMGLRDVLYLFYPPTWDGVTSGLAVVFRIQGRTADKEPEVTMAQFQRQYEGGLAWGVKQDPPYQDLKRIKAPTLVVNGDNDRMLASKESYAMSQNIPNAALVIYPSAGHAALFQYADRFVADTTRFLNSLH